MLERIGPIAPGRGQPRRRSAGVRLGAVLCVLAGLSAPAARAAEPGTTVTTALAEFGTPIYQPGFAQFRYVNPDAPKGGAVTLAEFGTFDSLNPYILRGEWPQSIDLVNDTLMEPSADEIGVVYSAIAESAEYPADKSWIIFTLRPEARFQDGQPITAEDVKFAFDLIREHGRPFLQAFYNDVTGAQVLGERRVKFTFSSRDRMKPLVTVAEIAPLPKHWWTAGGRDPTATTLEPPLGSGPYRLAQVDPGRSLTYERVRDYWGAGLPVQRGLNNFDRITIQYYRDQDVMFEAFKGGAYDFRMNQFDVQGESSELRWATGYDFPAVRDGRIVKRAVRDESPFGIRAYFLNGRRPQLADARAREALGLLYDFEWVQKNLLYGFDARSRSYFIHSDYGAQGLPGEAELALLDPYRDSVPERVFTTPFAPPTTDGSGDIRRNLRAALALFKEAGWDLRDGKLTSLATGEPFHLDILLVTQDSERWTQPWLRNLERAGIDARITMAPDIATWSRRIDEFDFDAVSAVYTFYPPPGPELADRFRSAAADVRGSANLMGIRNPVVDALLDRMLAATDLDTLTATTRALDRVLLWNFYLVPLWHRDEMWLAYWDKFGVPSSKPKYGTGFPASWWLDEAKAARLAGAR